MRRTCSIALTLTALLAGAGCARTPHPATETPARLKDSAPEKIAAQRAAAPGLNLESEDQRWGIEAARERRRATPPETPSSATATKPQAVDIKKPQ